MDTAGEGSDLVLYDMQMSGNCYKVRLTAALLGIKFSKLMAYDTTKKETRTPEYLSQVNADGQVPVLQIGEAVFLPESNAACYYLADTPTAKRRLIPEERLERARMLQWMFFEQFSHEPFVAGVRFWRSFIGVENLTELQRAQIPEREKRAKDALGVMERHLTEGHGRDWFVGDGFTLADVALYAYTHRIHEAGFDIDDWPAVKAWCGRVTALEGYVRMED